MTGAVAFALLLGGCRPAPTPETTFAKIREFLTAKAGFGVDFRTLDGARGTVDRKDGRLSWTFEDRSGRWAYRSDDRQAIAIRFDRLRYADGYPGAWAEGRLTEEIPSLLPPILLEVPASKGWTSKTAADGSTITSVVQRTPEGSVRIAITTDRQGRPKKVEYLPVEGEKPFRSWTLAVRAPKPFPGFDVPSGFVPEGLPSEPAAPEKGTAFPGIGKGPRRLVLVTGEDAPSARAAARQWEIPVVRKRITDSGVPQTATPMLYLVDADGKIVHRWVGDDDEIVADVRAAIMAK